MSTRVTLGASLSFVSLLVLLAVLLSASPGFADQGKGAGALRSLSDVGGWAKPLPDDSHKVNEVVVQFVRGSGQKAMSQVANAHGMIVRKAHVPASAHGIPFAVYQSKSLNVSEMMRRLKDSPGVVQVSPNFRHSMLTTPNDPLFPRQWALDNRESDADIDAPEAWSLSTGATDTVLACIDTGVDYLHGDIKAWQNPGECLGGAVRDGIDNDGNGYVDDIYGIDTINGDSDPMDDNGHGTHVAGIMAAVGNNSEGVAGVSWHGSVMALKALDAGGWGTDAAVIECINYVIDMKINRGVDVVAINASWGSKNSYDPALEAAIHAAGEAGIIFVAAAGNDGTNNDSAPVYPASYSCSNVIAVGASDHRDARTAFSNYGVSSVDLFAPGLGILSTYPVGLSFYEPGPGDSFFDDMEGGAGNWSKTGSWALTQEAYASPTHSWTDSPGSPYASNTNSSLTSRTIDLSALSGGSAVVAMAMAYELEYGYDFLYLDVSGNGGSTWTTLGGVTGYEPGDLYNATLPSGVLTSQFRLRFRLVTDSSVNYDGVYIDDVGIGAPLPSDGSGYRRMDGTSMAAPFVTGAVGVLASINPGESVAERKTHILSTVDQCPSFSGLCLTGGRLNLFEALRHATPAGATRYEQTHPYIVKSGTWADYTTTSASGGSYGRSATSGASATIYFTGTRLDWIAMKGTTTGIAEVYLDGVWKATINLAASTATYKVNVWSTGTLANGPHKVEIKRSSSSATGKYLTLDAVDVWGKVTTGP